MLQLSLKYSRVPTVPYCWFSDNFSLWTLTKSPLPLLAWQIAECFLEFFMLIYQFTPNVYFQKANVLMQSFFITIWSPSHFMAISVVEIINIVDIICFVDNTEYVLLFWNIHIWLFMFFFLLFFCVYIMV